MCVLDKNYGSIICTLWTMCEQSANHMKAICEPDMYCTENDVVWTLDLDETYCASYSDESSRIHYGTRRSRYPLMCWFYSGASRRNTLWDWTFPVFHLCAILILMLSVFTYVQWLDYYGSNLLWYKTGCGSKTWLWFNTHWRSYIRYSQLFSSRTIEGFTNGSVFDILGWQTFILCIYQRFISRTNVFNYIYIYLCMVLQQLAERYIYTCTLSDKGFTVIIRRTTLF